MSDLSEQEILSKHEQCLKEGADACAWLGRRADPEQMFPAGPHYRKLRTAIRELEGTSRQMAQWRADARWVRLGVFWAKVLRTARKEFARHGWSELGRLRAAFEKGSHAMQELRDAKTGTLGPILPQRASNWLILPEDNPEPRRLILPASTIH